jgi:hypothetical protein
MVLSIKLLQNVDAIADHRFLSTTILAVYYVYKVLNVLFQNDGKIVTQLKE